MTPAPPLTGLPAAVVAVRGGGEMATAAARLLFLCGCRVLVLERAQPLAVRRLVSFAEAVFAGAVTVEGVEAARAEPDRAVASVLEGRLTVVVDPEAGLLEALRPHVLLDARMAKANLGTVRSQARLVVALGPGFEAGRDVHAVVETRRGPTLGRVIWSGAALPDTAQPEPVLGHGGERVLRAPRAGVFRATSRLGALVGDGELVGTVGGAEVRTAIGGLLRGLVADGVELPAGAKLGDVDPRGPAVDPRCVSDKARAIAAGVLEAVVVGLSRVPGR